MQGCVSDVTGYIPTLSVFMNGLFKIFDSIRGFFLKGYLKMFEQNKEDTHTVTVLSRSYYPWLIVDFERYECQMHDNK